VEEIARLDLRHDRKSSRIEKGSCESNSVRSGEKSAREGDAEVNLTSRGKKKTQVELMLCPRR